METRPKITFMGKEVDYDDFPGGEALELADHFKPVKLSGRAIDEASKIVPAKHWIDEGLHTWLSKRAEFVFAKLSSSEKEGRLRSLLYKFEFGAEGPVLRSVVQILV